MELRLVNMDEDKDLIIKYRRDSHFISYGTRDGFDEEEYLKRMNERMMNLPEGQIIILEKNVPIGQLGLMIQKYDGKKLDISTLFI